MAEEQWNSIVQDMSSFTGCLVGLKINASNNASSEQFAIDDINFTEGNLIVLPVELLSFSAERWNNDVKLDWSTQTEINNDRFEIEKSNDGNSFYKIGELSGKASSFIKQDYTFYDELPVAGVQYYRLKQVDVDGSYSYSKLVSVNLTDNASGQVLVYPIPAYDNTIRINYPSPKKKEVKVSIFNNNGTQLLEDSYNIMKGNNTLSVSLPSINPGIYTLSVTDGISFIRERIIFL